MENKCNTSDVPAQKITFVIYGEMLGQVIARNVLKINEKVPASSFFSRVEEQCVQFGQEGNKHFVGI